MSTLGTVQGLTHPAGDVKWFGCRIGGYFFRLVDGDRYLAVLPGPGAGQLLDAIPFAGGDSDPRPAMRKAATDWARRRGSSTTSAGGGRHPVSAPPAEPRQPAA